MLGPSAIAGTRSSARPRQTVQMGRPLAGSERGQEDRTSIWLPQGAVFGARTCRLRIEGTVSAVEFTAGLGLGRMGDPAELSRSLRPEDL